jgi:hypothetical protein
VSNIVINIIGIAGLLTPVAIMGILIWRDSRRVEREKQQKMVEENPDYQEAMSELNKQFPGGGG